jgi:hypothetical protein
MTPWQVVEIVADESNERRPLTVADKARVRWEKAE